MAGHDQVEYVMEHPEEMSKLLKVEHVDEVKNTMTDIEKVLSRAVGCRMGPDQGEIFFMLPGRQPKRKMWLQTIVVLGTIIALILVIILSICHGFKCGS